MQIRIDEIDLVEMTDDVYFSDKYSNCVSNSRMSLINPSEGGSVEKFINGYDGGFNPSFIIGTAIHELVLQPELFFLAPNLDKPTAKMGVMADLLYKIYKKKQSYTLEDCEKVAIEMDYYANSLGEKRIQAIYDECASYVRRRFEYESVLVNDKEPIYLDPDNIMRVEQAIHHIKNNDEIQSLLNPLQFIGDEPILKRNEDAVIALITLIDKDGREYPLKFKQKMDSFWYDPSINKLMLLDLKTTGRYIDQFHYSFYKYRYFRQIGIYALFLSEYIKREYNVENVNIESNILLSCTIPDFRSGVFKVNNHMVKHGVWASYEILKIIMDNYDEIYNK